MLKITAETRACQFTYALHPVLVRDNGAPPSLTVHVVISHLERDLQRKPMVLIVEFDYMRINDGDGPCLINIELDALHAGIDLDRIEFQFVDHLDASSSGVIAQEDEDTGETGQLWGFRRAA